MSDPVTLAESIYLGDRSLKAILIDGWLEQVSFRVDLISRLRPGTHSWEYYNEKDIEDGLIVLSGVQSITLAPPGYVPNDYVNSFDVRPLPSPDTVTQAPALFAFTMNVSSVARDGSSREVVVEVIAREMHLEDPSQPGLKITD